MVVRTRPRRPALAVLVLAALSLSVSCVRVKAYERDKHASRAMSAPTPAERAEAKLDTHVEEYREGSMGGTGVGGGGCGCN